MKKVTAKPGDPARRRSGRPTKEQAEQLTEQIIDVATPLFLDGGFEATSIDSIVAAALISKQTFYARFVSKEALFSAVLRKRMDDLLVPVARGPLPAGSLETVLIHVGVELMTRTLTPTAVAVDRLISAEAHQFPLLAAVYRKNTEHVRDLIADVFTNAMKTGEIRSADAGFLAEQFQHAVVNGPSRVLRYGPKAARSEKHWHDRLVACVDLFLTGCRQHTSSGKA